ncbi:MAG: hypothetical protein A3E19_00740 [Planctomycetes bacterium RIFCSPHIGHO2_12_FULL_52_36]|nr:MAG: hypothetical protein A3D89_04075 [Planctomycetes bacterium RIFCSPHIGHO2_02_FULL_52_58]OHB94038.1 MAG: hypothetical protein A3E19_00740 [Planctomycetes bacterium RIFCSPHIGHO2_12_FULL_52_36]
MFKSLVLVAGLLVAVVVATGPLGVSLVTDSSVMAAAVCDKCKHEKCPGGEKGCEKCPDCQKK